MNPGGRTNDNEMMGSRSLKKRESLELKRTVWVSLHGTGSKLKSEESTKPYGRLLGLQLSALSLYHNTHSIPLPPSPYPVRRYLGSDWII